ncbi:MAG: Rieske (2Fe-2S) protein [Chloroflexi bacterium]|nr:Rieske (2Fe-2S) protein [Chloroflexota bacterium]
MALVGRSERERDENQGPDDAGAGSASSLTIHHSSLPQRVVVGQVEEIPPGQRRLVVPFRGRAGIGVFNIDGTFYALRNLCPHKSGPLCTGFVSGRMLADGPPTTADEGELRYEDDGRIIRCPWHLWEFDIPTGACLVDSTVRVKTYPVTVEGGQVIVSYTD